MNIWNSKGRNLGRAGNPREDTACVSSSFPNQVIPVRVLSSPRCICNSRGEILAAAQSKTKLSLTFVGLRFRSCSSKHWEQLTSHLQYSACCCQHRYSKQQGDISAKPSWQTKGFTWPHDSEQETKAWQKMTSLFLTLREHCSKSKTYSETPYEEQHSPVILLRSSWAVLNERIAPDTQSSMTAELLLLYQNLIMGAILLMKGLKKLKCLVFLSNSLHGLI